MPTRADILVSKIERLRTDYRRKTNLALELFDSGDERTACDLVAGLPDILHNIVCAKTELEMIHADEIPNHEAPA